MQVSHGDHDQNFLLGKSKKADFHEGRCLAMTVEYGTVRARPDL